MMLKTLALIGLLGNNVAAEVSNLRADAKTVETVNEDGLEEFYTEHLDLDLIVEGGERELFPLLPGTKCPTGHSCRVRNSRFGVAPMVGSLKKNYKTTLAATMDWQELNNNLNTVVRSNDYCTRRSAMARAAGLAAGVSVASVNSPAYAAETKEVKMGSDSGLLAFVPAKITICKGDSVTWINNKGGPHNVVFDEDGIPDGVSQEAISMDEQLGEEGETFTRKFDTPGTYAYYCEPHRGAGMEATLIVA
mmetsp:Transcript_46192/g.55980  ORF Transcript_46192/g.55980 Transcript_46192/m.55980 type:complete len:249 (-) Transcript_46192:257-1003(-)|eukprot:CAMPEP_0172483904 /NCGR_PEP_ID=MMETSP1066-20121228/11128_1 /TAXON_ID=671091 /ORGANISM="Coscinodiscus wailesii, Strain CCMP2513" /LENGTH=248 /DNA_ID=CAMNT_0013248085 /DNA_START=130 /DNA_END=876 /DNA_ORIENTATION=-